jgi:hypothetical protein
MVLMMPYDNGDYRVFGPCPSSGILRNIKEYSVSETGCFRLQLMGWETPTLLGPLEIANPSHWTSRDWD